MERQALINMVKIKLDEFAPEGATLPFDETIGPMLDESARTILETGPLFLITPEPIPTEEGEPLVSIIKYEENKAFIPVPNDFIRLYRIKFPLWKKHVIRTISEENPLYKIQENEFLASGYGRPYVAIVNRKFTGDASIKRYFECGRVEDPAPASITPTALYVKNCKPEELNDLFANILTWLCTSKVFGVLAYADKAKMAFEQFQNDLFALMAKG